MPPALPPGTDTQHLRERADTIVWIKTQMAKFGLHLADLQRAGCFAEPPVAAPPGPVRFRDAQGHVWDGRGDLPDWLQRAVTPASRSRILRSIPSLPDRQPTWALHAIRRGAGKSPGMVEDVRIRQPGVVLAFMI